jgi:hypothetical protein
MEISMKKISLLLGAIAFLVMGSSAAMAQGNGVSPEKFEVSGEIENPCCDGLIAFTGTVHVVINEKSGRTHVNYSNLNGIDGDGNVYHAAAVGNSQFESSDEDGSVTQTVNEIIRFSSSSGCSFTIRLMGSYGWNPEDGYWEDFKFNDIKCENGLS